MARHSPCVGICKLDDTTGFCIGCARTGDEIGGWMSMDDTQRDAVWQRLPDRFAKLAVRVRLLPWTQSEIIAWTKNTVSQRRGIWVAGAPGAAAEFPCTAERQIDVQSDDASVTAHAADAAFRLRVSDKVRAFTFTDDGPIVLGMPKARAKLTSNITVQSLGDDADAIDAKHRENRLFDFGTGMASSRFCVRTADENLKQKLTSRSGQHWSEMFHDIGMDIISASPHRVVETASARIEVFAPIPMPGTKSPSGAHTHFLPDALKSGDEIPAGLTLPEYALPVAIFYPAPASR